MFTIMPVPAEKLEKWNAVFDLLLFRQLKDDVDDTLVEKLVTFLDASVRQDLEFSTELWRGCDVLLKLEKALAVPRTSESLCFALRLIAVFGKLETMFTSLLDDSCVLKALDKFSDNAGAREQVSYLETVTSFLSHQSGRAWCIEHGVSSKVFQCLQEASVFVQGKAEAYFVAFLESDFSKSNGSEVTAFVNRTLTEELPPRHRKRCLHVIRSLLEKDAEFGKKLSSESDVHQRLLGCCVAWMSSSEASGAAADVLAKLVSTMQDDSFFEEVMNSLSSDRLVSIKFAASFIAERFDISMCRTHNLWKNLGGNLIQVAHLCANVEIERKIAETLTSPIATTESEFGNKSKVRALQSAAVCELKRALPHFVHLATHEMVASKIMQFLTNSSAVKVTRLLSVALECLAFTVEKIDLVQADATKLRSYLDNLAPFLRDPNLSAHVHWQSTVSDLAISSLIEALKQALAICLTFVCVIFSSASQDFDWRACGALCSFGESLQRQLVSTEPEFVEAALDSFGGIGNDADRLNLQACSAVLSCLADWLQHYGLARFVWDNLRNCDGGVRASAVAAIGKLFVREWLWTHFCNRLSLCEANVIKDVSSMVVDDADVFARRSAASTLHTWLTRDCLGLRSRHRSALQRCASTMLCLDLDCEVQLAGLWIWNTLLGESLGASSAVSDSTVKEILKDADTAGFGTSMKKAMACDADQEVRKDAQAFMRQLWTRLHDQCLLPEKSRVMGRTQDEVDASDGKPGHSAEAGAPMECCDNTSTVDRLAAMEEVLDLGVSECLQRKLKLPENIKKPAAPPTTCTLKSELVDTTELLARLSARGTFGNCDVEHVTEDFHSGDSLLEDILAAAASDHCDRDCY